MVQKNNVNQKIEEKSSKASDSIEATFADAEKALQETGDLESAYKKLSGESSSTTQADNDPPADSEVNQEKKTQAAASAEVDDDDDEYGLPESYRKETRELFSKLPKEFEALKRDFAKRARSVDADRKKFYSEYQSKTAFAQKLAQAINPYLESYTARGISPEAAIARAAKLDFLINKDPQAAAKFAMQIANLKELSLEDSEVPSANNNKQHLTQNQPLSQDEIRRIIQEEVTGISSATSAYQSNLEVLKGLAEKVTSTGKPLYPDLHNGEFCESLKGDVAALVQQGKPFDKAVLAAYYANGGRVEQGQAAQPQGSASDEAKTRKLQLASTIRPANSSTNSMKLEDIQIPDSIEDTFALAERLLGGR